MSETNELQTTTAAQVPAKTAKGPTIDAYLRGTGFKEEIMKLVGGEKSIAERFARVALSQVMTPNKDGKLALMACSVESLCRCLYAIAGAGLEPGRDVYLIPRGQECTYIIKWQGYVRAARASGQIRRIWANVIRKGDKYAIRSGSQTPGIEHSWELDGDRGDIIGAYACAEWNDGTVETEVLTREYLDRCRKSGTGGDVWVKWPDRQSIKTAIKRLCERLPLGSDASDALARVADVDPDADDGEGVEVPTPQPTTRTQELTAGLKAGRKPRPLATVPANPMERLTKAAAAAGWTDANVAAYLEAKHGYTGPLSAVDASSLDKLATMLEDKQLAAANLQGLADMAGGGAT